MSGTFQAATFQAATFQIGEIGNPQTRGMGGAKINIDWRKYSRKRRERPEYPVYAIPKPKPKKVGPPLEQIFPRAPVGDEALEGLVEAMKVANKLKAEEAARQAAIAKRKRDEEALILLLLS